MFNPSYMPFFRENYENEDARLDAIRDFIGICLKNHQKMKIWDDGMTVVVEYDYAEPELSHELVWLDEDEFVEKYTNDSDN